MLKKLVKNLKPSSTLLINETSKKLEDQGKKIYKFGFGQSPFKVPEDVVEELKNNAYQNKYLPMQGLEELRESVAKYSSKKKNYNYKANNVIIGPGSKELMFLLHVIFDGEIILPAPSWVSYAPQAILGRNKIQILQTEREKKRTIKTGSKKVTGFSYWRYCKLRKSYQKIKIKIIYYF